MFNKRNKLYKHLTQVSSAEDIVHNHAYSQVAGKSRAVPVRRAPARGRVVPGYRDSMVGSISQYRKKIPPTGKPAGADTASDSADTVIGNRPASGTVEKGKAGTGAATQKRHFVEPPKRNFNRFG